jgi:uncharacterized protein
MSPGKGLKSMQQATMKICTLFLFICLSHCAQAQQNQLSDAMVKVASRAFELEKTPYRPMIKPKKSQTWQRLNPLFYVSGGLLFFYQNVLSDQIQSNCMFEISCSGYTKKCIQTHGLVIGILLGADQLGSCHPFIQMDYEPNCIQPDGKIINTSSN